jgi:hypothetical protein
MSIIEKSKLALWVCKRCLFMGLNFRDYQGH